MSSTPPQRRFILQDDGNAVIYNTATGAPLWASGTNSSIRWKENVRPVADALEKIGRIRGVTFDWKGEQVNPYTGGRRGMGLIAEEVEQVFPEIVSHDRTGSRGAAAIDYDKMAAALVEAVKELKEENDIQRRQIEELRKKLNP